MLGLDAADPVLLERWTEDGTLPHLARLREEGAYGRLLTSAGVLAGSPWPTFNTGQPPSVHGIYHDFQWRHESMEYARPSWDWLPSIPFWRKLENAVRVVACDVPMTLGCQQASGLEVTGWASHDSLAPPSSHPPGLLEEIRGRFGEWTPGEEGFGRSPVGELLALRGRLEDATRRSAELSAWLLERPWDLALTVFGAPHRAGHRLWDRSSIGGPVPDSEGAEFDGALRAVYRACDDAVGAVLAAAGSGTTVMVFSLHGMTANPARFDLLDGMLAHILEGDGAAPPTRGLVRRLGEALPVPLRRALTRSIPAGLRDGLVTRWSTGGMDWDRTAAFTLRADLQGYIRINVRGREARGIVEPAALDDLCARIAEGVATFRDADSGEPLVDAVVRPGLDAFPAAVRSERLPDLAVIWKETPGAAHRAVESGLFGLVERETPGRIPNGRSGNHRAAGFLLAQGPGIPAGGAPPPGAHILDLPPTALALLGARCTVPLAGKSLTFDHAPTPDTVRSP